MKRGYEARVVNDVIISKITNENSKQEIQLSQLDFWDPTLGLPTILFSYIPELVIELEEQTNGVISLMQSAPIKTGATVLPQRDIVPLEEPIATDYYLVSYNPEATQSLNLSNPYLFYLSRRKGLYRKNTTGDDTYPVDPSSIRYRILSGLLTEFQSTNELARAAGTTPDKYRFQIKKLKEMVTRKFHGVTGDKFFVSQQGKGYRLGEEIKLISED